MSIKGTGACLALFEWGDPSFPRIAADCTDALKQYGIEVTTSTARMRGQLKPAQITGEALLLLLANDADVCSIECELNPEGALLVAEDQGARALVVYSEALKGERVVQLTRQLAVRRRISYGFCFEYRPGSPDPIFFSLGITDGYPEDEEEMEAADRNSLWFRERLPVGGVQARMRHTSGMVRDVFPENLLDECHLRSQISGVSLSEWVMQDPARGSLERVSVGNWIWHIDRDSCVRVRKEVAAAGLTVCYEAEPSVEMTGSGLCSQGEAWARGKSSQGSDD